MMLLPMNVLGKIDILGEAQQLAWSQALTPNFLFLERSLSPICQNGLSVN